MVFHSPSNPEVHVANITFTADEVVLSQRFVDYWAAFAITGNPNSDLQAAWPAWNPTSREVLLLQTPNVVVTNASLSPCAFWDSLGYDF